LRDDIVTTQKIERVFLVAGLTLSTVWIAARLHRTIGSREAIAEYEAQTISVSSDRGSESPDPALGVPVDFHLWSAKRISAYEDSFTKKTDAPLGILRIPKINLAVPIFDDTDDLTLNRGVGRILGTAKVGATGNLGIAGHRDGFFRGLQYIAPGDVVELDRPQQSDWYAVSQIQIVTPEDISVLNPTAVPTLTLVTCFPFYFVGHAPKRYIVTAVLESEHESYLAASKNTSSSGNNTKNKEKKR
jgi:sortase A